MDHISPVHNAGMKQCFLCAGENRPTIRPSAKEGTLPEVGMGKGGSGEGNKGREEDGIMSCTSCEGKEYGTRKDEGKREWIEMPIKATEMSRVNGKIVS